MAQAEPGASGVYTLLDLWQNDIKQRGKVCLVKMHPSSGVTSMSVLI